MYQRIDAKDKYEADNSYKSATPKGADYQIDYAMYYPERDAPRMLTDEEMEQKYGKKDVQLIGFNKSNKSNDSKKGTIKFPLSKNGKLEKDDSRKTLSDTTRTMIKCMSALWFAQNSNDKKTQELLHEKALRLRKLDNANFAKAVFLNDSDGASEFGHSAVMLINENGEGLVFSFYPTVESLPDCLSTEAEVRFSILTSEETENVLTGDGGIKNLIATDGRILDESYDRTKVYDIENWQGEKMYEYATGIYDNPGRYYLLFRNCDYIAEDIFEAGGINIDKHIKPNDTFENLT